MTLQSDVDHSLQVSPTDSQLATCHTVMILHIHIHRHLVFVSSLPPLAKAFSPDLPLIKDSNRFLKTTTSHSSREQPHSAVRTTVQRSSTRRACTEMSITSKEGRTTGPCTEAVGTMTPPSLGIPDLVTQVSRLSLWIPEPQTHGMTGDINTGPQQHRLIIRQTND